MASSSANILRAVRRQGTRTYHDLSMLPTRKAVVGSGPPGYSAVSGHVVTVFGCTGFLGRYLVSKLAKLGTQVVIPYRDEDEKRHLKPMGDLGQIVPMEWDIRREDQIAECLRHSDIVYNLVGRDYETKNFDFGSVHVDGAERIARIAAEHGVPRFVHVSHLNASASSPSKLYQAKAAGEERVRAVYKDATIVRPPAMYGFEDKFLNNMAIWPIWWKLNNAQTKVRPAHASYRCRPSASKPYGHPPIAGTINLPGPSTLTYEYLLDMVTAVTLNAPSKAPTIPKAVASLIATAASRSLWWPILSPDEVTRRYIDDAEVPGNWSEFGVTPSEIEHHAISYLRRYRSSENFDRPPVFPPRPSLESQSEY
ncbi:hypothetical protein CPB85DRAFT_1431670 [Mucidula mucida]|nr:hypothetical protein CPB85DRAFT_1431670 [Mucidula mucida]